MNFSLSTQTFVELSLLLRAQLIYTLAMMLPFGKTETLPIIFEEKKQNENIHECEAKGIG